MPTTPTKITWNITVTVEKEAPISLSRSLDVGAPDRLQVTVPGQKTGDAQTPANDAGAAGGDKETTTGDAKPTNSSATTPTPTPGKATVSVKPTAAINVEFLLITSTLYEDLSYRVGDKGDFIVLDQPQLLAGGIAQTLTASKESFEFENKGEKDAQVTIIVGRSD
jgi:hypothetical protein